MIGVISDSHEQEQAIMQAVEIFKDRDVKFIVHCGDVISPPMLDYFQDFKVILVFGNNDGEKEGILNKCRAYGWEGATKTKKFRYEDKMFYVIHGEDKDKLGENTKSGGFDYILTGHTHIPRDLRIGKTRVINPGTLLGENKTIVILDAKEDSVEFINVEDF